MYGANANHQNTGQLGCPKPCPKEQLYKGNMALIKDSSAIFCALSYCVFDVVVDILVRGSVGKIARFIVVPIPIQVPDNSTIWSWSDKRLRNQVMYSLGFLRLVIGSFPKGNRQVLSRRVWFSENPIPVLYNGNPSQVANFVPIMSNHWTPNFNGICHG
jgi:hypothetical protein